MEEQLEEVQQVLLYARAQRSSKQKEQPGQTPPRQPQLPPLTTSSRMEGEQRGTLCDLKAERTLDSPTENGVSCDAVLILI